MWKRVRFWCVVLASSGCLRDPDPGGQEGEEYRLDNPPSEEGGTFEPDSGVGDSGAVDDGEAETGDAAPDPDAWVGWSGSFVVERGLSSDPTARDCVLVFDMDGARMDACTDCLATFSVTHTLRADDSQGREACVDPPDRFTREYVLRGDGASGVALSVKAPDGSEVHYGSAELTDGIALRWSVGSVAIPSTGDEGTLYRTDVESGDVLLD